MILHPPTLFSPEADVVIEEFSETPGTVVQVGLAPAANSSVWTLPEPVNAAGMAAWQHAVGVAVQVSLFIHRPSCVLRVGL